MLRLTILTIVALQSTAANCRPLVHSAHALSIEDAGELAGLNALSVDTSLAGREINDKNSEQVGEQFIKYQGISSKTSEFWEKNGYYVPKPHLPYHSFWDYEGLEAREINGKTPKPSTSRSTTLNAGSLKKSSTTYRTSALSGQTYTKGTAGKVQAITTPSAPPAGKDADHILEAQTVSKALQKGGYKQTSDLPGTSHQEIKDALNHSSNMAFVDSAINRSKGQANKSALSGKTPAVNPYVHDYVKQTAQASKDAAKAVDDVLTKHGITGVSVQGEQNNVLKQMGLKRELMLDELDQ